MAGKRYNTGKPRMSLIPAIAEEKEAFVWTKGAEKYGEGFNWAKGGPALSFSSILDSMGRHYNALKKGQDIDPESGEHHAAHIRCNAAMLLEYYYKGDVNQDDRYESEFRDLLKEQNNG